MGKECLVSVFETWWPRSMVNFLYILIAMAKVKVCGHFLNLFQCFDGMFAC